MSNPINKFLTAACLLLSFANVTYAATLTGLQECQAIKNPTKKSECFDKQIAQAEKSGQEEKRISVEKIKLEKAEKVLQIIKRLQTRVETGVSYRDYPALISDPMFEVKNYIRENQPNEIKEFAKPALRAVAYYDIAGTIWGFKFAQRQVSNVTCEPYQESLIRDTLADKNIPIDTDVNAYCKGYVISVALRAAWEKASESIVEAENELNKKRDQIK